VGLGIDTTLIVSIIGMLTIIGHNSPHWETFQSELICQGPWNQLCRYVVDRFNLVDLGSCLDLSCVDSLETIILWWVFDVKVYAKLCVPSSLVTMPCFSGIILH
jgi:hypothetical protein